MKIGACLWSFTDCHRDGGSRLNPFDPFDFIELAATAGLTSVECGPGQFEGLDDARLDDLVAALDRHGLELFMDTGGASYAEDISPLVNAIELAHRLGARVVRTTISGMLEGDRREFGLGGWQQYLAELVAPLRQAMELATRYELPVGLENHQDACAEELMWLCESVDSPLLGVTMDVANALAVGETPQAFAAKVMPRLKHVHLKDYTIHATASGYVFKRCALGDGVVDWPAMVAQFAAGAPQVRGCIELGATQGRHVRILEDDYWATYLPRPLSEAISAIRCLHPAARPAAEDCQTPHEHGASAEACAAYEMDQFDRSAQYVSRELVD
jgi:3-oxoisoapionate decarboxylase